MTFLRAPAPAVETIKSSTGDWAQDHRMRATFLAMHILPGVAMSTGCNMKAGACSGGMQ